MVLKIAISVVEFIFTFDRPCPISKLDAYLRKGLADNTEHPPVWHPTDKFLIFEVSKLSKRRGMEPPDRVAAVSAVPRAIRVHIKLPRRLRLLFPPHHPLFQIHRCDRI
jgi:hypothetical protein